MGRSDVIIVGGGTIGLAIALELQQQGISATVLSQDFTAAAGHAAAGMLAPSAEHIAPGPLAELCLRSLHLYPNWVSKLENLTGLNTGYWPCGILAPRLDSDGPVANSTDATAETIHLSDAATHRFQSGLSPKITSARFYPEDAQVDNRALMKVLAAAAQDLGIEIQTGVSVEGFMQRRQQVVGLRTSAGEKQAAHYILAAGAWSADLLPVPVTPRKGQMLSLRVPIGYKTSLPLQRVLFGEQVYIVPRRDGRIIIGATVEDVGFTSGNTPAGIAQLLNSAIALYPELQTFSLEDHWWGFRPATPDEQPILGAGPCQNLTLATGHYRNGILLAPITAQLVSAHVQSCLNGFHNEELQDDDLRAVGLQDSKQNRNLSPSDLLNAFSYRRFFSPPDSPLPQRQLPSSAQSSSQLRSPMQLPTQLIDSPRPTTLETSPDPLIIAGKTFRSRLMTGTGKFSSLETMRRSFVASGSEIVTVAVRRVQTNAPGHEGLAEAIDWQQIWMLPNTAGCTNAEEAIRVARLGREMAKLLGQEDNNFVKLEVIPDAKYLLPDPIDTLKAAEQLVKEGFAVLPYINADPLLAKRLEEAGCATVMPLGSPIGSGQGIRNAANIQIIIENAHIPVVVDAGIGTPSEAAYAMELGADALLINSAIALAQDPVAMGQAMGMATQAGRLAYQAGRIPIKTYASASSPTTGTVTG
jgi:thiazole synthase